DRLRVRSTGCRSDVQDTAASRRGLHHIAASLRCNRGKSFRLPLNPSLVLTLAHARVREKSAMARTPSLAREARALPSSFPKFITRGRWPMLSLRHNSQLFFFVIHQ